MRVNEIPFAKDTVTVYNRVVESSVGGRDVVSWNRHVLQGCRVASDSRLDFSDGIASRRAVSVVYIPCDTDFSSVGEWNSQARDDGKFTLDVGDIIVPGNVADVIGPGLTSSALVDRYRKAGAFVINSVCVRSGDGWPMGYYMAEGSDRHGRRLFT